MKATVDIVVVTHDDAAELPGCLRSVASIEGPRLGLVIVDCASSDTSPATAREHLPAGIDGRVVALEENVGFAGGMNVALAHSEAPFVLSLNADARPSPTYVVRLLDRLETDPERGGAATGRLLRWATPGAPDRLDACGMRLTPSWRHLDRGSGEIDSGQFAVPEEVFGATGAASLFRRRALDDVALPDGIFAPEFHSFREDAELCFRLRERGWRIFYEPAAVARHRRRTVPERRSRLPAAINRHSLKNRYLLRTYHQTARNLPLTLLPAVGRDLLALSYVLLRERSSLPAYTWLWRHRALIRRRRRWIQGRRTRPAAELDRWFFGRGAAP